MTILIWLWAIMATLWAIMATMMLVRNPLPLPDRGHRAFALPSEESRGIVAKILKEIGGLESRFTFDAGPTHQTLMWDGYTVLNYVDPSSSWIKRLPGNAISLPVKDPRASSGQAAELLKKAHYTAVIQEIADSVLPPNHLVVLESDAFQDWVLVFRRHIFKMPRVERRKARP